MTKNDYTKTMTDDEKTVIIVVVFFVILGSLAALMFYIGDLENKKIIEKWNKSAEETNKEFLKVSNMTCIEIQDALHNNTINSNWNRQKATERYIGLGCS